MCVEQKCVPVGEVTADLCKDGCGGNGVCNSRGHCHCDPGWGPPNCLTPGDGGSEDSGPALDNSGEIPHRDGAVGGGTSTHRTGDRVQCVRYRNTSVVRLHCRVHWPFESAGRRQNSRITVDAIL